MAKKSIAEVFKIAVDAGRGLTLAVMFNKDKTYRITRFASTRAEVSTKTLNLSGALAQVPYYRYEGLAYVVGDDTMKFISEHPETEISINSSGGDFQRFLVATALYNLNLPDGARVHLGMLCPPGVYDDMEPQMVKAYLGTSLTIQRNGDNAPRTYHIENVTILPESWAASHVFTVDRTGQPLISDTLDGQVIWYDPGVLTLDIMLSRDGNFDPGALRFATNDEHGIDRLIRMPILAHVQALGGGFKRATSAHIDYVLRKGMNSGDWTLTMPSGESVNLAPVFQQRFASYYGACRNNILAVTPVDNLLASRLLIGVGGGSLIQDAYLRRDFPGKILDLATHSATRPISSKDVQLTALDLNVVGVLLYMTTG
jgi:hypothetical protein